MIAFAYHKICKFLNIRDKKYYNLSKDIHAILL